MYAVRGAGSISSRGVWCETRKIIFQGSQPRGFQGSRSGVLGLTHQVSRRVFIKDPGNNPHICFGKNGEEDWPGISRMDHECLEVRFSPDLVGSM